MRGLRTTVSAGRPAPRVVHRLTHFLRVSPCLAHPHGRPCLDSSHPGSSSPDSSPPDSSPSSGKQFPWPWLPRVRGAVLGSNPGDNTSRSSPVRGRSGSKRTALLLNTVFRAWGKTFLAVPAPTTVIALRPVSLTPVSDGKLSTVSPSVRHLGNHCRWFPFLLRHLGRNYEHISFQRKRCLPPFPGCLGREDNDFRPLPPWLRSNGRIMRPPLSDSRVIALSGGR